MSIELTISFARHQYIRKKNMKNFIGIGDETLSNVYVKDVKMIR